MVQLAYTHKGAEVVWGQNAGDINYKYDGLLPSGCLALNDFMKKMYENEWSISLNRFWQEDTEAFKVIQQDFVFSLKGFQGSLFFVISVEPYL